MKFGKLTKKAKRKGVEQEDFWEDVKFDNADAKKLATQDFKPWKNNLEGYAEIELKKYKDLFSKFNEIVFPVEVRHSDLSYPGTLKVDIVDNNGKEYSLKQEDIYDEMLEYSIREKNREPLVDVEYSYLLSKDEETELVKFSVIKLKEDEEIKYTEKVYETYICDNISLQTVNLYGEENGKLKIEHPRNKEIDKEILDYFLEDDGTKWYYYNVFSVFNWLVNKISDKEASVHIIAEIDGEVYSEIEMVKGIVKKHVVTQIINEGEMHIIKKIFAKRLNEFLLEEKNRISK